MRLAYKQGLLSGRSLNPFQQWALEYWMSYDRWESYDRRDDFLKRFLHHLDPKRYFEVYPNPVTTMIESADFVEAPIDPSEFGSIDDWLKSVDKARVAQGVGLDDDEGWL